MDQREQILAAARRVFGEKGFSGATVAEIAAEAEMNPATLYRFFSGKRALFEALGQPELDFPDPQARQRREELVRAALQVFGRKGYAAATMDDIAAAVGLSKAGVYVYFPSKESLFSAAVDAPRGLRVMEELFQPDGAEPAAADLETGLTRIATRYLSLFDEEDFTGLLRIVLAEGPRDPAVAAAFTQGVARRGAEGVARYLARFETGDWNALIFRAQTLFGALFAWGLTHRLLAGGDHTADAPAAARAIVQQFLGRAS